MDPQDNRPAEAEAPPADQDAAAAEERADAAASPPSREPDHGLMNRFLRGVGSLFRDEEPSADEPAEPEPPAPAEPAAPATESERVTMTAEEFRRAVQSAKDRELVAERRQDALARADAGDIGPISALAEKGDAWARHQLAERGETWRLGEIHEAELKRQAQAAADPTPQIATSFDQTVIWPLLAALPEAEEKRIVGSGIVGMAGRRAAVEDAIGVLRREAVTSALSDQRFAARLLGSPAFRDALFANPAANKQYQSRRRWAGEEPDHVPAAASSRRRENDFMNDLLRNGPRAGADDDE